MQSDAGSLGAEYESESESHQHQDNCAEKCGPESANVEAGYQGARQQQNQCVDHQDKQAERKDADGERQQLQQESQRGIEKADDEGREQRRLREAVDNAGYTGPIEVEIFNDEVWKNVGDETIEQIKQSFLEFV